MRATTSLNLLFLKRWSGSLLFVLVFALPGFAFDREVKTFCRFVPERADDFAWENDKIAFRAYGPALRGSAEDSGFDCWLKRVDYPIVNKWYAENAAGKSYHKDHGEGYDPYKVGASRGCGGLALWMDGKMVSSNVFRSWEILKRERDESIFVLNYEYRVGEDVYTERKRISIRLGDRLFKTISTFAKNGKTAIDLPIAIGLVRHHAIDQVSHDLDQGWLAIWETIDDADLGVGLVLDPARIEAFQLLETGKPLCDHAVLISRTDARGQIEYHAGYGWQKAGEMTNAVQWNGYLEQFAKTSFEDEN